MEQVTEKEEISGEHRIMNANFVEGWAIQSQ